MEKLININNFKNTTIIPAGISTEAGVTNLDYYSEDLLDTSASIIKDFRPGKVHHTKKVVLLNSEQIKIEDPVSILKIDVEGAEYFVLLACENIVKRDRPLILIEILPVYSQGNIERLNKQNDIIELMIKHNYSILRLDKNSNDTLDTFSLIKDFGIHSNLNQCDYLLVPTENLDSILSMF